MSERRRYRTLVADSARWDGFQFRPDDIVISTPPKCGTTWTQMLCALLVFDSDTFDRPMAEISPWLDMQTNDVVAVRRLLDEQSHRRFIKTHTPLDGLPFDERVTYLCVGRDPRDVCLSWDNHMANTDVAALFAARSAAVGDEDLAELMPATFPSEDATERFWSWIDTDEGNFSVSLFSTLDHLRTFWDVRERPNIHLFHYADLQADLAGQTRRLADILGIEMSEERIAELVQSAGFERMKERADDLAPDVTNHIWLDNKAFFHVGSGGQWRDLLDDEGLVRYEARVAALVPPDLAAWAHGGWLGAATAANSPSS